MKKVIVILGVFVMMLLANVNVSEAKEVELYGFTYDDALYNVNVGERIVVTTKYSRPVYRSALGSILVQPKSNSKLTVTTLTPAFFTTKNRIDGCYYQAVAFRVNTTGQTITSVLGTTSSCIGYPQFVTVKIGATSTTDKTMRDLAIQPKVSKSRTSYSIDGATVNIGPTLSVKDGFSVTGQVSFGITADQSWEESCLDISTRSCDGGYAYWEYDYKTSSKNKAWNIYCYSDTEHYGLLSWRGEKDYGYLVSGFDISVKVDAGICKKNSTVIGGTPIVRKITLTSATKTGTIDYK